MKPTNSRATVALRRAPSFRRCHALSLLFEWRDFFAAIDALELIGRDSRIFQAHRAIDDFTLDVERVLGGVAPHLMVTDPPYGVNYDPAIVAQGGRVITIQADVADPDAVAQQSIASSREYAGANVEIRRVLTQTQALDHPIFCQNR